ncbi:MAG TPA: polymer-forming cytoskeletal protein [Gammaproteobacteria bacterium]|nr:polymer-forming cytoskeletal protein [Gammaproteobacteria bacterium]
MKPVLARSRRLGYRWLTFAETFMFKRRIQDSSSGPTTYIAPSTRIVGSITGQGAYVFCGTIEGDCDIDGPLTLADGGRWKGTIKATDIVVAGVVEGDVVARQRVEIAGTARVSGSLSGNSIAVAEGAVIEGEIRVTSGIAPTTFEEKRHPDPSPA